MGFLFSFGATFLFLFLLSKNLSKILFLTRVVEEDVDIYIILLLNIYVVYMKEKKRKSEEIPLKCAIIPYFFG